MANSAGSFMRQAALGIGGVGIRAVAEHNAVGIFECIDLLAYVQWKVA